ncbi:MAG: beta-ketoacyl-[acyl-carrier-protein] synthase family protein [Ardenticatenaceae bacterium]|nr:beta-ketoacyl-[acyl-carrier-protein] synthase family protein [Ardenticatenaceae bacterium]HBY94866.1 beta-ketoacyl-[acyl-carrier-protein] synthase II [Chloroflexota bacterium]
MDSFESDSGLRRVVVTGMGAITSLGRDVDTTWKALLEGRSGIRQIRQFPSDDFPVRIGSEVDLDGIELEGTEDLAPLMSRSVQFGIWALEQAWQDACLKDEAIDPWRSGVCIGAASFPILEGDLARPEYILHADHYHVEHYLELCRQMPELLAQRDIGTVATLLSMRHPLYGISTTVQTACASATQAIGEAYHMIRHGEADLLVSGGTDSMMSALPVIGFSLLGVTSFFQGDPTKACRPFDRKRDGLVVGEGAGIVILEELEHARRRGARIHAEVIGYGSSCDGYRFTDSHPEGYGPISCMRAALEDAGIAPEAVDYINAHGTATVQNDRTETTTIKRVFGDHAYRVPISSTKSQLGHLICAAGGIELIVTVLAMNQGIIPPTINLEHPDPACDLDYVPNRPRPARIRIAISNSFGFGGQNGTVVVRRWEE